MFKKLFVVLIGCLLVFASYAWGGTDYDNYFVDACASRNLVSVSKCNSPGVGCLLIAEKYAIGELYNCDYQLCPGGYYNADPESGGCTVCVDRSSMPFFSNNMDDNISWGGEYESDTIYWRWYKAGAKSEDGCLYIATCPTGRYMTSDTLDENNATYTSDLYCKACAGNKYDKDTSNIFILKAYGRGASSSILLAYTPSEGEFADVDAVCGYTCPENSHTNVSGTGCECNTGYHPSGNTDANGQPICQGDMVDITLYAYVCDNPNVAALECMDTCSEKQQDVKDVLEIGKTYTYDEFLAAVSEKAGDLITECRSGLGAITYNYIDKDNYSNNVNFGSDKTITIPADNGGERKVAFCVVPKVFPVRYSAGDAQYFYNERTYYNSGYTAMTAEEATVYFTPDSGLMLSHWVNNDNKDQIFKPGDDLSQQCETLDLIASESECVAGNYCSNWSGGECPAGTTSEAGADSITECYLGGDSKICDENSKCFTGLPKLQLRK
ncbi:MAG: hypothetical protein IKB10_04170 [Alphaproteobacteria bacterium]|nr:hypothetical protein [Alphaproteobacteria bacterium]